MIWYDNEISGFFSETVTSKSQVPIGQDLMGTYKV